MNAEALGAALATVVERCVYPLPVDLPVWEGGRPTPQEWSRLKEMGRHAPSSEENRELMVNQT